MVDSVKKLLVSAMGPEATVVVGGQVVQGEVSPAMRAMMEAKSKINALGDDFTEADIEAIMEPVRRVMGS